MTPNKEQLEAINDPSPDLLIVAGPGSGKTFTLVERIVAQLDAGTDPAEIVVITYTNAAAHELQQRIGRPLGYIGTLHGFCLKLLRQFGGFNDGLTVLDEDEEKNFIARLKIELAPRSTLVQVTEEIAKGIPSASQGTRTGPELAAFQYYDFLKENNVVTYDAILWFALDLLRSESFVDPWPWTELFVDEVQDCSPLDMNLYNAMPFERRTLVGDPDQAVFGWRGGSVAGILQYAQRATVRKLTLNHRSQSDICGLATLLISKNKRRIPKETVAVTAGGTVDAWLNLPTDAHEYAEIAKSILTLPEGKTAAVLVRTNFLVEQVTAALSAHGIEVAARHKAPWPDDWTAARRLVALLAAPNNDYLAFNYLLAKHGEAAANKAKLCALETFSPINAILQLPTVTHLGDVARALAKEGIGRTSLALIEKAVANMPDGATVADLAVELRSELLPVFVPDGRVVVSTLHGSKGREWDVVFIAGMDADLIPLKNQDAEEERRLLFVGITRARERVVLSTALARRSQKWQRATVTAAPSPFFADMDFEVENV